MISALVSRLTISIPFALLIVTYLTACSSNKEIPPMTESDILAFHQEILTIDTHVDTPLRLKYEGIDLGKRYDPDTIRTQLDYPRMAEGGLDGAFFAVWSPQGARTDSGHAAIKIKALETIRNVKEMVGKYPDLGGMAYRSEDAGRFAKQGKRAIYLGLENGYPLGMELDNIDTFYELGIRYVTLCHTSNNEICDSSNDSTEFGGLSPFGFKVIERMNRLGMMIDISHVSDEAFFQVLELSSAPTVATHSSLRHFVPGFERNVSDEMMIALAKNGGVLQLNFGDYFIRDVRNNPDLKVTIADVVDHVDRVVDLVGIDHIGIGSDYDGIPRLPVGLEDVSTYPQFIKELLVRGYSDEDVKKIMNGNILRVWKEVRRLADD